MNIEDHPIYAEVAKAYADCGPVEERFERGEGDISLSDNERFEALVDETMEIRNLGFRASQAVDPATAQAIMEKIVPSYNEFKPNLLGLLPDDCKVVIAREGSVCIYVQRGDKKIPSRSKLKASEYDLLNETVYNTREHYKGGTRHRPTPYGGFQGELRIWWD